MDEGVDPINAPGLAALIFRPANQRRHEQQEPESKTHSHNGTHQAAALSQE